MNPDCADAVAEVLGRPLHASESKAIEDEVNKWMRLLARQDPAAWGAKSYPERLQAAAKAAADEMVADVQHKQRVVRLSIAAHDRIDDTLSKQFAALPADAPAGSKLHIVGQLLARDTRARNMQAVDSWAHSIANEAVGRLTDLWMADKGKWFGFFEDSKGVRDIEREFYGEDSGNAAAKAGVKEFHAVADELRLRANAAGRRIGDLGAWWHKPQSHSQSRIAAAGPDRYINDALPELDRSMYLNEDGSRMSDGQLHDVLLAAYDSITTDGLNKTKPGARENYSAGADRGGEHRVLFFKDSDSYLRYAGKYAERSLWPTLIGHIKAMANNIALAEVLGPRDEEAFRYFNDRTQLDEMRENPTGQGAIDKAYELNKALYDAVAGRTKVVNQAVHDRWQAFRNFTVAKDLGMLPFTALSDEAGMATTAWANNVPWSAGLFRQLRYLNPLSSADRRIAQRAGLGVNGMIGNLNRFGSEDFGGGGAGRSGAIANATGKLASFVLRSIGMEAMWDGRRDALGSMLMSYVGEVVREHEHFADINQQDHGILATKGVTEKDWQVWKLAQPEDWGVAAHSVLTPKSIRNIPDEQLAPLGDPDELRRHASTMLLGHVLEETGMGVMDQGVRERTRMRFGTIPGTAFGELASSTMLFKGFSASMMMKHWARASAMPTGADRINYTARLFTIGTAMGAVALQLANVATGKNPENMASPLFWLHALVKGGGLGFYGDFMYNEMNEHGTSLAAALGGPVVTDPEQVAKLTLGAAIKAARGKRTDEGANLVRFAHDNVPVFNNWYLRAATNHLIWNDMQEAASPGYLDRMQAKAYAERGTSYYWDPHDTLPKAAPDVGKMWQPGLGLEEMQKAEDRLGQ